MYILCRIMRRQARAQKNIEEQNKRLCIPQNFIWNPTRWKSQQFQKRQTSRLLLLPLPTTSSTATCSLSTPHPLSMLLYSGSLWNLGSSFCFFLHHNDGAVVLCCFIFSSFCCCSCIQLHYYHHHHHWMAMFLRNFL